MITRTLIGECLENSSGGIGDPALHRLVQVQFELLTRRLHAFARHQSYPPDEYSYHLRRMCDAFAETLTLQFLPLELALVNHYNCRISTDDLPQCIYHLSQLCLLATIPGALDKRRNLYRIHREQLLRYHIDFHRDFLIKVSFNRLPEHEANQINLLTHFQPTFDAPVFILAIDAAEAMTESRSKPTAPVIPGSPRTLLPWKPQQSILQTLDLTRATAAAFPSGLAGFSLLNRPLIVGPSGTGKSTLVTHWAQTQGMAVFTITPASWIVLGATHHTPTLHRIESHLRHHADPFVIFLDHLDGYRPGPDSWTRSVHEELLMLLDKRIQPDIDPLLDKVFLIGAGAWAEEFRDKTRYLPSSEVLEYQQTIPPDILNRFSWPPLLLPALERSDFAGFLTRMALEHLQEPINPRTLDELCASAVRSERNFRWLESHAEDNARLMAMAQLHQP